MISVQIWHVLTSGIMFDFCSFLCRYCYFVNSIVFGCDQKFATTLWILFVCSLLSFTVQSSKGGHSKRCILFIYHLSCAISHSINFAKIHLITRKILLKISVTWLPESIGGLNSYSEWKCEYCIYLVKTCSIFTFNANFLQIFKLACWLLRYKLLWPVGPLQLNLVSSFARVICMQPARLGQRPTLVNTQGPIRLRHACYVTVSGQCAAAASQLPAVAPTDLRSPHRIFGKMSLFS